MKKITKILLMAIFPFVVASCHKDDKDAGDKDCGCGGIVIQNLKDNKGTLSQTKEDGITSWIIKVKATDLPNDSRLLTYIVCNKEAITQTLKEDTREEIPVVFSADLFKACEPKGVHPAIPPTTFHINLNAIDVDINPTPDV